MWLTWPWTERARGAYGDLYTSIQSRRFKPGPGVPKIEESYRPVEAHVPGRALHHFLLQLARKLFCPRTPLSCSAVTP